MYCSCYFWVFIYNFSAKFGFVRDPVCNFAITFAMNVNNIFQIVGFLARLIENERGLK